MSMKIRFVTCPTCREILPELPGVPLYKCGVCATMLQAKNDNVGSASETNLTKKHGHRNEQHPADEEHTEGAKGDVNMSLLRENNGERTNEIPGRIFKSCPNTESAPGANSIDVVEGHKEERSLMMEKEYRVLNENNAIHLGASLILEEENVTNGDLGKPKQSMLTESTTKDDKDFKETEKEVHNFGPSSSEENLETLPNNHRRSIGLMSKSPTKIYYDSDIRKIKGTDYLIADRRRIKDKVRFKKMQKDHLRRDFISTADDWKQHPKLPESREKMREGNNDSDTHGMAKVSRSSLLPHGNRSPSSIRLSVSQQLPEPHLHHSTFYDDPDKRELLNKVYELQEKLSQIQISEPMPKRRFNVRGFGDEKVEKHSRHYDEYLAKRRNACADVEHSGHHCNHPQGLGCTHHPEISRVEFLGEATGCRNQRDCACSHCCHHCCHQATKTCSHCILSQHAVYPRENYDNEYPSYSRSPQTRSNKKFSSQVPEGKSDNQLHQKKDMRKLCLGEKYQCVRRHVRPIAGGAPIMACRYCSELLQLPAEHTLSKRHFYMLKCYSCERVMKLTLERKVHIVPYIPTISAPPPSEIDGYSDTKA